MSNSLIMLMWIGMATQFSGYLFQSYRIFKSNEIKGLNPYSFFINFFSCILWFTNAMFVDVLASALANSLTMLFLSYTIYSILKYKETKHTKLWLAFLLLIAILSFTLIALGQIYKWEISVDWLKLTIGFAAGITSSFMFVPQVIRIVKTKITSDYSTILTVLYGTAVYIWTIFWLARGLGLFGSTEHYTVGDWIPGFIFSLIPGLIQTFILFLKISNKLKNKKDYALS